MTYDDETLRTIGLLAVAEAHLNAALRRAAESNDPAVWDYRDMWEAKRRELRDAVLGAVGA